MKRYSCGARSSSTRPTAAASWTSPRQSSAGIRSMAATGGAENSRRTTDAARSRSTQPRESRFMRAAMASRTLAVTTTPPMRRAGRAGPTSRTKNGFRAGQGVDMLGLGGIHRAPGHGAQLRGDGLDREAPELDLLCHGLSSFWDTTRRRLVVRPQVLLSLPARSRAANRGTARVVEKFPLHADIVGERPFPTSPHDGCNEHVTLVDQPALERVGGKVRTAHRKVAAR